MRSWVWWHVHGSATISGEKKGKSKYLGSLGHIHSNLEVSQETFSEKNKKLLHSNPEENLSPRRHIIPKTNVEY